MSQQDLDFGTAAANDGETLASAFLKIQQNFDDLYDSVALLDGGNTWSGAQIFNEVGADVDFRIEGDTNANLFFLDASADAIGIGTSSLHTGARMSVSGGVSFAATSVGLEADPASAYFGTIEAYASSEFVLTQSEVQAADESGGWRTALALYHNDGDATDYESLVYRTISDGLRVGVFGPNDGSGTYSTSSKDYHGVSSQVIARTDWTVRGVAAYTGDSVQFGEGVCLNELTMSNPSASNAQSSQIAGWYVTLSGKKAAADGSHTNHGLFVSNQGKKATAAFEAISAGTDGDNGQYGYALKLDVATVDTAAIYMPASAATDVGTRILYESGSWSAYDRTGNAFTWAVGSANVVALDGQGIWPATDGGASLGYPTIAWQNLYLNTLGTINIDNGNWVATHTSGILTVGTGDLRVTNNFTDATSVVTLGGAQTLTNKTLTAPVIGAATGTSVSVTGALASRSGTATPAAASAVTGLAMGSAAVGIYWGTGSPNTALTAPKGSLYIRTDAGGATERMYINTDASTAWTNATMAG
jgi:hypothetical protein